MNKLIKILLVLSLCACSHGEVRTWTLQSGETYEGEYDRKVFDDVVIKDAEGTEIRMALKDLSAEDRAFVELLNPPELSVDFLESAQQVFIKPSPLWPDNSPITVLDYQFGARIKKLDSKEYPHELYIEGYELSQQVWDLDKYRLIHKFKSEPFILSKKNREIEYESPRTVRLIKIIVDMGTGAALPRGQKMSESLVIVRDKRGEIVTYRSTAKWMYKYLDRLEGLPQGAWLNRECIRVHPSSPPAYKLNYMPSTY